MKSIRHFIKTIAVAALSSGLTGCNSFLEEYSQDLSKVDTWTDLDELLLGSAYILPQQMVATYSLSGSDQWDILNFMADELRPSNQYGNGDRLGYGKAMFAFYTWQQDTGVDETLKYIGNDNVYFDNLYKRINVCNMAIALVDDLPAPKPADVAGKERVKGEAYYLRGAFYFMLANLYCEPYAPSTASQKPGLPLKFSEFVEDREFQPASLREMYEHVVSDLEMAEKCLEGKERKSIYHANRTAAQLLLSRVYLYMQNWEKAAEYAAKVIEAQPALLDLHSVTAGSNILTAGSPETIFSMGSYSIAGIFADTQSFWSPEKPYWLLTDETIGRYGVNDLRKDLYVGTSQYIGIKKVFGKVDGQNRAFGAYTEVGSNFLMRTAEAYLNLAEAQALAGNENGARKTLEDFLATRMTGDCSVTLSGNDLIDMIREERARELLLEGHRWFDLRRYTVCEPYPWSKPIEHVYAYFTSTRFERFDIYRLEAFDPAYTLPLPRSVRQFQTTIGGFERQGRTPIGTADRNYFVD